MTELWLGLRLFEPDELINDDLIIPLPDGALFMELASDRYTLDLTLTLNTLAGTPLKVRTGELSVKLTEDDRIYSCYWRFHLSPEAYQQVDQECLFHLNPDVRAPGADAFHPNQETEIEVRLASALLGDWPEEISDAQGAAFYLQALSQAQPSHLCFLSENWYALSVLQTVELPAGMEGSLKSGYKTHWATLDEEEEEEECNPSP